MDDDYLTEHWLFNQPRNELDEFIILARKRLNEDLENEQRRTNSRISQKRNQ